MLLNEAGYSVNQFQYIPCYGLSCMDRADFYYDRIFQYIPCYGLSDHICLGFQLCTRFQYIPCYGLSIYPQISCNGKLPFHYIPCYGLSGYVFLFVIHERGFQYIPCYGLSRAVWICKAADSISIHPMLRFISLRFLHFSKYTSISIHPMLQFIINVHRKRIVYALFQYIPCYGLSPFLVCHATNKTKFQYIPCYGLSPDGKLQKGVLLTISIHPMLRFI